MSTASFFDDKDTHIISFRFMEPVPQIHQEILRTSPTLKDYATCINLDSNLSQQGYFALHEDLLVFSEKDNQDHPTSILDISFARLKLLSENKKGTKYGFTLTKNKTSFEFFFQDQRTVDFWVNALKPICVMTNFHEEYKGLKSLGKGAFARVYLVNAKTTGETYAAKAFTKGSKNISSNLQASLINEIKTLRSLDHRHIIQLYEVQETENTIYLIMEYVESKTLREVLRSPDFKKSYSEAQIMYLMHSLLDALAYLASKGIMHRDLKPDNILVEKGGKIKIIDFGLADNVNAPKNIYQRCGTAGYIAPEVFYFDPNNTTTYYNHTCDMFSVGCIFYYMLFGHPLFDTSRKSQVFKNNKDIDDMKILYRLLEENESDKKLNKEGINLLLELLQCSPEKRITVGDAFVHAYFQPIIKRFIKFASSKDIIFNPIGHRADNHEAKNMENQRVYTFKEDINPFTSHKYQEENSFCVEGGYFGIDAKHFTPKRNITHEDSQEATQSHSSNDLDEVGSENCQIQSHIARYKDEKHFKHPSKLVESHPKFYITSGRYQRA